jgi:hypothetical protein
LLIHGRSRKGPAMRFHLLVLVLASLAFAAAAQGAKRKGRGYPPSFPEAKGEVYKAAGEVGLNLYVFHPAEHKPGRGDGSHNTNQSKRWTFSLRTWVTSPRRLHERNRQAA